MEEMQCVLAGRRCAAAESASWERGPGGERGVRDKVRLGRSRVGMLNNKSVLRRRSKGLESWS